MSTEIYRIEGPWRGTLGISAHPRGGDWLEDEIKSWRGAGFDVIVSLLTPAEIEEMDLSGEADYARAAQLEFISFPIEDRSVPRSRESGLKLIEQLESRLARGKNVNVHCRQGVGRSALIAAGLLIGRGVPSTEAVARISTARHVMVPETPEQRDWIRSLVPTAHPTVS